MVSQGNNYLSNNININNSRYANGNSDSYNKRLGDRTLFSHSVDGKRYFSSLDAEIYFGETYIDNVVQINWAVEQSTMPLYGYNSYVFDDLAVGARQVGGSFVINFTKAGLLYDILRSTQATNRSSLNTVEVLNENTNIAWTSNFDKEHKASWDRSFNVRIGYGDETKKEASTSMLVIHCVQITGCQQVIGIDGSVIAESYTFIAKDIRYDMTSLPAVTDNTQADNNVEEAKTMFQAQIESLKIEDRMDKIPPNSPAQVVTAAKYLAFVMKYNFGGGEVIDVKMTLKRETGEVINSSMFSLGNNSSTEYRIPREFKTIIDKAIKSQTALSTSNITLLCDLRFEHAINGTVQPALIMNNKKVYITQ